MNDKRRAGPMLIPTIVLGVLAVVFLGLAYYKGGTEQMIGGLKAGGNMLLQIIPLLIFAMILAGVIPRLIPQDMISSWVGAESGWRGIFIGSAVGAIMPGGPYVSLPLAAGLLRAGAGIGAMVALLTSWSVIAITRLPMEIGIMGWKFACIRIACGFFFPPIDGFIAARLFGNVDIL
jgi:uncharacterized membrane protein YraQ (UPF0718 family)